jgi:hypothetical protein
VARAGPSTWPGCLPGNWRIDAGPPCQATSWRCESGTTVSPDDRYRGPEPPATDAALPADDDAMIDSSTLTRGVLSN